MSGITNFQSWVQRLNDRDRQAISPYIPQIIEIICMPDTGSSPELILAEKTDKLRKIQHMLPDRIQAQLDRLILSATGSASRSVQSRTMLAKQSNAPSRRSALSTIRRTRTQKASNSYSSKIGA